MTLCVHHPIDLACAVVVPSQVRDAEGRDQAGSTTTRGLDGQRSIELHPALRPGYGLIIPASQRLSYGTCCQLFSLLPRGANTCSYSEWDGQTTEVPHVCAVGKRYRYTLGR